MTVRLQAWYKLAFKLFVSEQWEVISERVENGDESYRWIKEQLIAAVHVIQKEAFHARLGGAASNLEQRLLALKSPNLSEEDYARAQHWFNHIGGKSVLGDESQSVGHRVIGAKIALLEASLVYFDEPAKAGLGICQAFDKLSDIDSIVSAIYENNNPKLAAEIKVMFDCAKEYAQTMNLPIDDLIELEFEPACLPAQPPTAFKPPEIWVFGDYGNEDGLFSHPDKLQVDQEGNFLVMDQDVTGEGTVQRIQLFNPQGKYIKVLLKRGEGKVNGMKDFCLDKKGNLVVLDTDDNNMARVQKFDYDANQLLVINVDKDNPDSVALLTTLYIDDDDTMVCADIGDRSVHVYMPDGKLKTKFGGFGRSDGSFVAVTTVTAHDNKIYALDNGPGSVKTQVFDYDGKFISKFGPAIPYTQVVFDASHSQIYAINGADHRIEILDMDGTITKKTAEGFGASMDDLWGPSSLVVLGNCRIAISERDNHRVKVFQF